MYWLILILKHKFYYIFPNYFFVFYRFLIKFSLLICPFVQKKIVYYVYTEIKYWLWKNN